jgi:hypothetical protein
MFVGPNNAGKSQSLRDIAGIAKSGSGYIGKAVSAATFLKEGSRDDALTWAEENLPRAIRGGMEQAYVAGWGEVSLSDFAARWTDTHLGPLTESLILHADGTTRLTAANAPGNVDFRNALPVHPIQKAARNPALEAEFGQIGLSAFGLDVIIDRYAGSAIPMRMGPRPLFNHENGMPSIEYLNELAALPQIEEQGDGVRSLLGVTTQLIAGSHQILLVDEPEAFLHPPQARLLGRLLAARAVGQQVFIATHSADIVRGALEAGTPVTIIRLAWENGERQSAILSHAAVRELWSDPLLRYSDILTGLFHDAVVLCESDADCRYYASVRDQLNPETGSQRRSEILFTHCGGKARMHTVVTALNAVDVPVVVVADFDILRDVGDIERTFSALGGDWQSLAPKRNVLNSALVAETRPLKSGATKEALLELFDDSAEILSAQIIVQMKKLLKVDSGWDKVKRSGLAGVPQGDASAAAVELLNQLKVFGLFVVPVGELERFAPGIGGHGPAWVNAVLEQRLHESPSTEATTFVSEIEQFVQNLRG